MVEVYLIEGLKVRGTYGGKLCGGGAYGGWIFGRGT
jgi:hypothetical protein